MMARRDSFPCTEQILAWLSLKKEEEEEEEEEEGKRDK
jgi:hypothetical protein